MASLLASLPDKPTMRDINDLCVANGIPSLAQGLIELPPPLVLRRIAGETALQDDVHTYRDRFGAKEYREALAELLKRHYHADVPVDSILATQGVTGGIVSSLMMAKPSDRKARVALVQPFYTYHLFQIERVFGTAVEVVYVDLTATFSLDWEALQAALKEPVDALIVCNPSNPTGKLFAQKDVERLVQLTAASGTLLIVDECYCDMIWEADAHPSPIYLSPLPDHVVVVRGFSKVLGCQSWRVGYVVSSPKTVAALMRINDPIYICCPWPQHSIGTYVTAQYDDFVKHKQEVGALMRDNWRKFSKAFKEALGWEPIEPEGTMYGLFKHPSATDIEACVKALEAGVGVCPGSIFWQGNPSHTGYTRIHCGVSAEKADQVVANLRAYAAAH